MRIVFLLMLDLLLLQCVHGAGEIQHAPLMLADLQGQRHRLADYRGQVALVNFWGTWCRPCRKEMPSIEKLYQSLQGRGFAVLAVNVRQQRADVSRYVDTLGLTFTVLLDRWGVAAHEWGVNVYPTTFLVGPQGRIQLRKQGAADWNRAETRALIEQLLAKPVASTATGQPDLR